MSSRTARGALERAIGREPGRRAQSPRALVTRPRLDHAGRMSRGFWPALCLTLSLFVAESASADVPPPDNCTTAGTTCSNAPPDYKTAGTCKASTCHKGVPGPDGGITTVPYDCLLCVAANGSGGANTGDSGTTKPPAGAGDSGCNCIVSPARAGGTMALVMLVIGSASLLSERRLRRRR